MALFSTRRPTRRRPALVLSSSRRFSQTAGRQDDRLSDALDRARRRQQLASGASGAAKPVGALSRFLAVPARTRMYFFLGLGVFATGMLYVTENVLPGALPEKKPPSLDQPGLGIVGRGPEAQERNRRRREEKARREQGEQ